MLEVANPTEGKPPYGAPLPDIRRAIILNVHQPAIAEADGELWARSRDQDVGGSIAVLRLQPLLPSLLR